jgi:GDP-L-fucose synthase
MTVIVAGSSGLVGSAITKVFESHGYKVVGINRSVVDLKDKKATRDLIGLVKPVLIVDAAAKVGGIGANNKFPVEFLSENLAIQENLMSAAYEVGVEKFIFLGSSCIYPSNCTQPIEEEFLMTGPLEPSSSAYALAKIAGIELINSYRKQFGLHWISLVPANLYGPNDNFRQDESHVIPAFIRRFIEAEEENTQSVYMWGSGSPLREFMHVDDLAKAVLIAHESYDSDLHLNIGTGEEISIKRLAELIAEIVGYRGLIEWDQEKPDGNQRKVLEASRVKALGWNPTITLPEGIASTIAWYKEASASGDIRK